MNGHPFSFDPEAARAEVEAFRRKLEAGMETLKHMGPIELGTTPREAVYTEDKLTLWHFKGSKKPTAKTPLLICYALVNTPWMVDLQEDRSMVRNLLAQGEDVYLIDWGYPDGADRWLTLEDYIDGYLDRCIDVIRQRHAVESLNLLGICQGGVFSLCYATLHPEKVRNLVTMVTPVDFHTPDNMLSHWARNIDIDLFVDTYGNVPADVMNFAYLTLKPVRLNQQKYVGLVDILDNPKEVENFLRMEKWIFDSPDQAGEAFREFARDFFQKNQLIKGEARIGGKVIDLKKITHPVLNIYAEQDHLVPPAASTPMAGVIGSKDYTALAFKGGHIGIYVSGRAQAQVPPAIHEWLAKR
ncbi:class III poly(R)-hydroxyalkanoic acid synthase subunit PhaC [Luteibacter rhizovicinus DSM 16549]|uniref:Poly(3-hydroxyalkanoate) polymerase subunit PhaC n=2 Tax=Luteibacter rhizovicinus TaxID=242606 RepID=A0A1L3EYP3_9GAMM|nr:class III poly(R)-hydroxyalkanoic acid synthase subunit PhaC [Luteibacter rhizovicinus]APG06175.1 class III poly(R)-hydroxyalkanoic acid synthase subunit PhaC [Luteibacter rhizovicinus DSM 16549]KLD73877.1 poly-beta-hydroxybutyrate polymerase [Xanthomonas hyacinthi DSM 19077]